MLNFNAASVSELVNSIKNLLEDQFQEVMVQGEVTNLNLSGAGHWYFNLSDEDSLIACALFRGDALRNPLIRNLKNGDKIVVVGPISVYQKKGSFQITTKRIFPAGEGQLKLQFERLKAKLAAEGLFDIDRKKPVPAFPKKVAVITAEKGAALQDFLKVMTRRSLWMNIVIIPTLVQGDGAPKSLIEGIKKAKKLNGVDVIVITRGGGSLEDLWAFNDEMLVREISLCPIPVISAVGHEVDFTLSDYVADLRSETPTAAAETLSQPQTELNSRLIFCYSNLKSSLLKVTQQIQIMLNRFHPRELLNLMNQMIYDSNMKLSGLNFRERGIEMLGVRERQQRLDEAVLCFKHAMELNLKSTKDLLLRLEHVLEALSPKNVLNRGYSYLSTLDGEIVTSKEQFDKIIGGTRIELNFYDGSGLVKKE